ncbi:hypothetical protein JTE90_028861 [Oedothorax gibbosus]|uniref:Uncharacterized protein n=1 Tax=Oedothorax gibbosus TaxID=931172 RepID=A0AAV6U6X8_9ARAC|nr:hypothetical protein JTE90_028861 [Oedothorax gibbosus]
MIVQISPINWRLCEKLCNDMDRDHYQLLLHCEVRWLSKCNFNFNQNSFKQNQHIFTFVLKTRKSHP